MDYMALRSKQHSFTTLSGEAKNDRRVSKSRLLGRCCLSTLDTLRTQSSSRHQFQLIRSKHLGLTAFDDKRYVLEDGVRTLAYGHYRIKEIKKSKLKDNSRV